MMRTLSSRCHWLSVTWTSGLVALAKKSSTKVGIAAKASANVRASIAEVSARDERSIASSCSNGANSLHTTHQQYKPSLSKRQKACVFFRSVERESLETPFRERLTWR